MGSHTPAGDLRPREVVLSVVATRDPWGVFVGSMLERMRDRLAAILVVEPDSLRFDFGLAALTEFGLTRRLDLESPLVWHDDLEVLELDVITGDEEAATISIRHGCLAWDQLLPVPLEESLATVVNAERAARAIAVDAVWWFGAALESARQRAIFAALACAIAEGCDGIISESEDERVFATPDAFMSDWAGL